MRPLLLLVPLFLATVSSLASDRPAVPAKATGSLASLAPEPEPWKGKPYDHTLQVGAMAGLGLLGSRAGMGLNGTVAFKILHTGFLDDINDQAFIELMLGPIFFPGATAFSYSAHLRWDLHKNDMWTFYSLGGFGGVLSGAALGNTQTFHPRFGIGALWNVFEFLSFRAELSHEFTGLGIVYIL